MKFRRAGNSGLFLSELGLGTWLSAASARMDSPDNFSGIVAAALRYGMRFFDTADVYVGGAAEASLGNALRTEGNKSSIVSSKCFFPMSGEKLDRGLSRKHLVESVKASAERLGRPIDIQFCHRFDADVPMRELVLTMKDVIAAGYCHYWGTSEWPLDGLRQAIEWADRLAAPYPVADQFELNVLNLGRRLVRADALADLGIGAVAWGALAGGLLTGKYEAEIPTRSRFGTFRGLRDRLKDDDLARAATFARFCIDRNVSPVHVAIRALLREKSVTSVLLGATQVEHIDAGCSALDIDLEERVIEEAVGLVTIKVDC